MILKQYYLKILILKKFKSSFNKITVSNQVNYILFSRKELGPDQGWVNHILF